MREGDFKTAITAYSNSINKGSIAEAYIGRGRAYFTFASSLLSKNPEEAKGIFDLAIKDYTKALEETPLFAKFDNLRYEKEKYVEPLLARATVYMTLNDYQSAMSDLSTAIERNPDFYDAYLSRANLYVDREDYQSAIQDLRIALNLNPNFAPAFFLLGFIQNKQQNYKEAVSNFTEILNLKDTVKNAGQYFERTYYYRGIAYLALSNNQAATNDLTQAIALNPNFDEAYLDRGLAEFNLNQYQESIQDINKVFSNNTNNSNYEIAYYPLGISGSLTITR